VKNPEKQRHDNLGCGVWFWFVFCCVGENWGISQIQVDAPCKRTGQEKKEVQDSFRYKLILGNVEEGK